jgi:ArsR family transcriptional regulator, virulence genes transcriptional regulator
MSELDQGERNLAPVIEYNIRTISDLLKAMSNNHRLRIICSLQKGEKTVGELKDVVDVKQSGISQHLAWLRDQKIVETRRHSQNVYYSLAKGPCRPILQCLNDICPMRADDLGILNR